MASQDPNSINNVFWSTNVFAAIVGGLIAGFIGVLLALFHEWRKDSRDKKAFACQDIKKIQSISDYLKELEKSLKQTQENWCPQHVILPFVNYVEFAQFSDEKLAEIRELYNSLSYKIYAMENFLVIQGDPSKIGQDGSNKISEKHKEL
jgi:hypothetical protein